MSEEVKDRFVQVPKNASVLIVTPGEDGVGFQVRVNTPVPDREIANDLNQTPERVCAVAVYTAAAWLVHGHPMDRKQDIKLWTPGDN